MQKQKQPDLSKLFEKANQKSSVEFLRWLKKSRPGSIEGKANKVPFYSNAKNKSLIESDPGLKMAEDLCERIIKFVTDDTFNLPDQKILRGIIHRLRLDAKFFTKSKIDFTFVLHELTFLSRTKNHKEEAMFALKILKSLNVPYNDQSCVLYETLIEHDDQFVGEDRLEQRRILSLTYRDLVLPPFFVSDNIFWIEGGKRTGYDSLTPDEIEQFLGYSVSRETLTDKFSKHGRLPSREWDFLVIDRDEDQISIYNSNCRPLKNKLTGNSAKVFRRLLSTAFLEGATKSELGSSLATRLKEGKPTADKLKAVDQYRKQIRQVFNNAKVILRESDRTFVNPRTKILLVIPAVPKSR